jgi:hypothetical protein
MSTHEPVKVADFWEDEGVVSIDTSNAVIGVPVVRVRAFDDSYEPEPLDFTAAQAREFAAAIVAAADAIDPDGARPLAVVDNDGDVWRRDEDGLYRFDGLCYSLDVIRADYGPVSEVSR